MARCPHRKRLYEHHLADVEKALRRIYRQSDWAAVPGALEDANLEQLIAALEDILDTYVVYGVQMDLERLQSRDVFRTDVKRPPALDEALARPASSDVAKRKTIDKKRLTAKQAYLRYFEWCIDGEVSQAPKKSGVQAFYERYPLLGHAVTTAANHYKDNIRIACDRVKKDWRDIQRAFFPGKELQHLARITTTGNDFHKGGKQVLILTFALKDGTDGRVVYKPSAVEIDCRLVGTSKVVNDVKPEGYTQDQSLTEIINTYNPVKVCSGGYTTKPLRTYVILPYRRDSVLDAYGYIQFLTHEPALPLPPGQDTDISRRVADAVAKAEAGRDVVTKSDWIVTDPKDAQVFYYQLGALMAMALAVSLCDLHVQNAIAHERLPHLIDLEEALKRPMATITDTLLDRVAVEYWDPGTAELQIKSDRTADLDVTWASPPHTPATCTLYRYDPSRPPPERVARMGVICDPALAIDREPAIRRHALVCGLSDVVGAIAGDDCHKKVKEWVDGLKQTIARFVPVGTKDYLDKTRTLYWKFGMNAVPGAKAPADYGDYREFKNESGDRFFTVGRRSLWETKWKTQKDSAEWNPYFAVDHPDHAWKDYLNGDVPAFYHKLGSRDLLNCRGEVVDVAAVNQWQVTNLGADPLPNPFVKEYFPRTPVDMVVAQLDALKTACSTPKGKRDYVNKIMEGADWLGARSPLDNFLPRLHSGRGDFPFAAADMRSLGDLVSDFIELDPLPQYKGKEEPAVPSSEFLDREIDLVQSRAPHSGTFAYAKELEKIPFRRVVAYGFRGDGRKPLEFKAAVKMQGFLPNYTRPTHTAAVEEFKARPDVVADPDKKNFQWIGPDGIKRNVAEVETGAFDLRFYITNEFMGGYVSLTRYAMVARSFACGMGGTRPRTGGWVYCCLAEGAFYVPRKGEHAWATKNEAELAMPGMLDWEDIVGFREVTKDGQFTGPVYLRRSLQKREREAFTQLYQIFSGKNQ